MKNILEETMEELNDEKKKALLNTIKGGHTAVIAVPGSGKTKTIVETAKALILTKVRADKILLLTLLQFMMTLSFMNFEYSSFSILRK